MRLGRTYEQAIAQKELPVRPAIQSRVRIGPRGLSLFLAIALASLIAYLFVSDDFYVYEAIVQGNRLVSTEEIYESSEVQGYSIFFIEPHQVEQAICSLPDVREAKVDVSLPNQMIVEVRERQARVIWLTGQELYGVDEEGTILPLRGETPSISIRDLDTIPRQPGELIDLTVIEAAERYKALLPETGEFGYSQQHGLSLVNEHGWRIYLGNDEGAEIKVAIMNTLVQSLVSQGRMVEFIDLRFQGSPYYRLAGG
jgi:cell division septal protein FtsQ